MTRSGRRFVYYGWIGQTSLGDEALYKAICGIFNSIDRSIEFIPVPADTYYGFQREYSPVTIVGGSTGIPDWMNCLWPTHYSYVFGSGVKDLSCYLYRYLLQRGLRVAVWIRRLRAFRYIGVRGELSKDTLASLGLKSEVIGDPTFSLQPNCSAKRVEDKIAINLGSDGLLWGMNESIVFREIAKVIRDLKKEGYTIVLIPFRQNNVSLMHALAEKEGVSFFNDWFDMQSTLDLIASCQLLIGERVHSLGLSAAAGTPFIGLDYQPPLYEIAQSVGFGNYTIRTDKVTEEKVTKKLDGLLDNYEEMQKKLKAKVSFYRRRQAEFALRIVRDVETLPEGYWKTTGARKTMREISWKADALFSRKPTLWNAWDKLFFSHAIKYLP